MKRFAAVLVLAMVAGALVASSADAAASRKKCPPNCKHRQQRQSGPGDCWSGEKAQAPGLWRDFVAGLELRGGFRWDRELVCSPVAPTPVPCDDCGMKDPPFIGPGLSLPLSSTVDARGSFDLDLDGPYQGKIGAARVELAWRPWRN